MSNIKFRDYKHLKSLFVASVLFETMVADRRSLMIEYRVYADDKIQGYFEAVFFTEEGFDSGICGDWPCLKN